MVTVPLSQVKRTCETNNSQVPGWKRGDILGKSFAAGSGKDEVGTWTWDVLYTGDFLTRGEMAQSCPRGARAGDEGRFSAEKWETILTS